jgi:hypothetical protein
MPQENKDVKPTDIVEVELKGKKFKVTKAFKDELDADRGDLVTKVTGLETQTKTLSQKITELETKPMGGKKDDTGGDGDDNDVSFSDLMDKPQSAIDKAVEKYLKKKGIDPSKLGATGDVDHKVAIAFERQGWWNAFYKEHDYFDQEAHDDLIQIQLKKLMPKIKDLPAKEGRAKIAEAVADMLGRKITKGKLEYSTKSKHEAEDGMQLEGADSSDVDNGTNANDTDRNKGTGSMADDLRRRKEARAKAARGK